MPKRKAMTKPASKPEPKTTMTPAQQREEWNRASDVINVVNKFTQTTKLKVLVGVGVGSDYFTCYLCSGVKHRSQFYTSTDANARSGVSRICKECYDRLSQPSVNSTTEESDARREGLKYALEYVDQPFFERLFRAAQEEASVVKAGVSSDPNRAYKRLVASPANRGKRWRDGEFRPEEYQLTTPEEGVRPMTPEEAEEFKRNKTDVLRVAGYYPFDDVDVANQALLYAEFAGYLEEQQDDYSPYWISCVIQIIKNNAQMAQIDRRINQLLSNPEMGISEIGTVNTLIKSKADLAQNNTRLAKENCISLKDSKTTSRGDDSFTGRTKYLDDLNLRDADLNRFDIDTCKGMQQVADCSMHAIFQELSFDENDYTDMIKIQRELLQKALHEAAVSKERTRLLLRENLDLKNYMKEQGVKFDHCLSNNELFDNGFMTADPESVESDVTSDDVMQLVSEARIQFGMVDTEGRDIVEKRLAEANAADESDEDSDSTKVGEVADGK